MPLLKEAAFAKTPTTQPLTSEETLRREAHELRVANRELEAVVYTVAHDLTEPIRTIIQFSSFLLEDLGKGPTVGADEVRRIHAGGLRLKRLLDDLLQFSRSGHPQPAPGPVDPNTVMAEVKDGLAALLAEHNASLTWDRLDVAVADSTSLFEVLANLVSNGVKFNDSGSPTVRVTSEHHGEWVEFQVTDNGVGIPPEHQKSVFDLFFRLGDAQGSAAQGTGAGLAIARRLVQRYGGRIWVESNSGLGSTFRFTLPAGSG